MIDASALVELLLQTAVGARVERAIGDAELMAPDVLNPEIVHALRGLERGGKLTSARASRAVERLSRDAITRVPTLGLLREAWSLRANLSAYDACYVALARALDCPLLTVDGPMKRAPNLGVTLIAV
ncbi:MAG TPA: type II toxin-antitoxin system VapC family toxin [Solirubrobacteraceae bacterium]|nr:type II toxin-antitoxin system VapC family toxin [Solirubrobacteraceae bacterium]